LFEKKKYLEAAELYQGVVNSAKVSDVQTWAKFRLGLSYRHLGEVAQGDRLLSEIGQYDPDEQTVETSIRATASAVLDEFVLSRGVRSK
jgi:TolA-binding protein